MSYIDTNQNILNETDFYQISREYDTETVGNSQESNGEDENNESCDGLGTLNYIEHAQIMHISKADLNKFQDISLIHKDCVSSFNSLQEYI